MTRAAFVTGSPSPGISSLVLMMVYTVFFVDALAASSPLGCTVIPNAVERMRAGTASGDDGIACSGSACEIVRLVILRNGLDGIQVVLVFLNWQIAKGCLFTASR